MESPACPQTGPSFTEDWIVLDPSGNLTIINKCTQKQALYCFRVCSRKLSMASSVFSPFFPDDASHKKQYEVFLNDNNPESMRILLELCHFVRRTPMPSASLESVKELAVLSQKYGLVNLMAPWVMTWSLSLYDKDKLDFSKGGDLVSWLKVCLIFGQEEMFVKITRRAIITATAESLDISAPIESPFKEIIETIALHRITVISEIITVALKLLARYQTAEGICKESGSSEICRAMLMNSVLGGPMSFGLYQPVPVLPYSGMSAMGIIGEIKDLQLRTDPSHSETCGREIKMEIIEKLRIAIGILELVEGLDLSEFNYNPKTGQIEGLLLQIVQDQEVQIHDKDLKNNKNESIRHEGSRGDGDKEETEEPREEVDEDRNEEIECSNKDGGDEQDESSSELSNHTNGDGDFLSETSDVQVPAGVIDGFSETEETIEDFGPQIFFREGDVRQKIYDTEEDEGEEQKQKEEDLNDNFSIKEDNDTISLVCVKGVISGRSNLDKERPAPMDEACTSQESQVDEHTPNAGIGESTLPKVAPLRHAVARANAEAQGQTWSTPGPELARKYQRGPRIPFPDDVTVGDVSNEGHIANLKVLKNRFPTLNSKRLIASLKQTNWDLQLAIESVYATESTLMDQIDTNARGITVSVSNTSALEPIYDHIVHKEPDEYLEAPMGEAPSEVSTIQQSPQKATQESGPIVYEESGQDSITPQKALLEDSITLVPPSAILEPVLDSQLSIPQRAPLNDSNTQKVVLPPAALESAFDRSSFTLQETTPEDSTATQALLPPSAVSLSDRSSSPLTEAGSGCSATKKVPPSTTILISISRLIAGKLTMEESEKRFWPPEEDRDIKKYLDVIANRKIVKKLVHRFPGSSADKGLIDVLYRSGWDLEKATSRLEGLGLVRRAN